jgi:hypothetical protein
MDVIQNGLIAAGGGAAAIAANNFIATFVAGATKKDLTPTMKNWMLLLTAAILGVLVPKTGLLKGKNAEIFGIGAVAVATISILKNTFGLGKFLTIGTEEEEIDEIIANLNVSGIDEDTLLGTDISLMGITEMAGEEVPLMGIAEGLEGISDDYDSLEEYE